MRAARRRLGPVLGLALAAVLASGGFTGRGLAATDDVVRPLLVAAADGDVAGVRDALDAGVPIDAYESVDERRWTALLTAASWGRRDVVELLIARGADPSARDARGAGPLGEAARDRHDDVVALLLADPRTLDAIVADLAPARAPAVRRHAAWDAGFTASTRVIAPLHAILLEDADAETVRAATASLVRLSRPETVPALADALARSDDPIVTRSAGEALLKLDPERARATARTALAGGVPGPRADIVRSLLLQLGDRDLVERSDRARSVAPALLALAVLAALAGAYAAAVRDTATVLRRLAVAARDAIACGAATVVLLVTAAVLPGVRALVGLSAQPYAEGAPLAAALLTLLVGATGAWSGAVASFADLASGSRRVRALARSVLTTLLALSALTLLASGAAPLDARMLTAVVPRAAALAAVVGVASFAQGLLLAPAAPSAGASAWPLDRLGPRGLAGFALAVALVLASGPWIASAFSVSAVETVAVRAR